MGCRSKGTKSNPSAFFFGHLTPAKTGLLGHSFSFRHSLKCCQLEAPAASAFSMSGLMPVPHPGELRAAVRSHELLPNNAWNSLFSSELGKICKYVGQPNWPLWWEGAAPSRNLLPLLPYPTAAPGSSRVRALPYVSGGKKGLQVLGGWS